MNPLKSVLGTIISGFVLAIIIMLIFGTGQLSTLALSVWFHVMFGVIWIGLLYYFNFVQVPGVGQALADKEPGPAAINKYIAPRALLWFRWAALGTWLTGMGLLGPNVKAAFMLTDGFAIIGVGAWLVRVTG